MAINKFGENTGKRINSRHAAAPRNEDIRDEPDLAFGQRVQSVDDSRRARTQGFHLGLVALGASKSDSLHLSALGGASLSNVLRLTVGLGLSGIGIVLLDLDADGGLG